MSATFEDLQVLKSSVREASAEYIVVSSDELPLPLFSENDLRLLGS